MADLDALEGEGEEEEEEGHDDEPLEDKPSTFSAEVVPQGGAAAEVCVIVCDGMMVG